MIKKIVLLLPILVFLSIGGAFWNGVHSSTPVPDLNLEHPVVVELFTSQGCSSCPPADRFLSELSAQDNVIALSCHVTYWDYLGWKDSLSQEFCTNRQRASARHRQSRSVFTPELLINGQKSIVGSNRGSIQKALKSTPPISKITLSKRGEALIADLPSLPNDGYLNYTIWVLGTQQSHDEQITRGENRGRNIRYARSVITLDKRKNWMGEAEQRTIAIPKNPNVDTVTILAQAGGYGQIIAAGEIALK